MIISYKVHIQRCRFSGSRKGISFIWYFTGM